LHYRHRFSAVLPPGTIFDRKVNLLAWKDKLMKLRILSAAAAIFVLAWAQNANAIVVTEVPWSGLCLDCSESGPTIASATISVVPDPEPEGDGPFFSGAVVGVSYVSELFEFTSLSVDFGFLELFGPLPSLGDMFIIGVAEFTVFDGAPVGDAVFPGGFALATNPDNASEWALCLEGQFDRENPVCSDLNNADFGVESVFGPTDVPEPSGLAIVGFGLLGLAALRRRQRAR
jgi:hypothetical protein